MQSILKSEEDRKIKLLVINPNTEKGMTEQIEKSIETLMLKNVEIKVITNEGGPVSIEGHTDEIVSAYQILKLLGRQKDEVYDGYLIACFSGHPAVNAIRELTGKPVIGIAEASCYMAAALGESFGIVTTSTRWVPMLKKAVADFGIKDKCSGVLSCGLSVVQLQALSEEEVENAIIEAGKIAVLSGAEVICLGCAGMSGLQQKIERELGIPVVDPCASGVMLLYSLCLMKAKTSRICMYAPNEKRRTIGLESEIKKIYE